MKPNAKQRRWLRKYLPKGARVTELIPRAYCVLKPAPGCAAFAMPHLDCRAHLATEDNAKYNSGVTIHALNDNKCVYDLLQGDWSTLVYATTKTSGLWYCTPKPIPWNTFKEKKRWH